VTTTSPNTPGRPTPRAIPERPVSPGPTPRRRSFNFSLRTLLFLMAVAGLCLGWFRDHRRLTQQIDDLRNPNPAWSTNQVIGPPDTPGAGDIQAAWASRTPDAQNEWLLLEYDRSVCPDAVLVHETFNLGAVSKVSVFKKGGEEIVVWTGTDPTPRTKKRGVSVIPVAVPFNTRAVKIYIDSRTVPGWNEVDAVGLRYAKNKTVWRARIRAALSKKTNGYGVRLGASVSKRGLAPFMLLEPQGISPLAKKSSFRYLRSLD
jgi:hypothetical protein